MPTRNKAKKALLVDGFVVLRFRRDHGGDSGLALALPDAMPGSESLPALDHWLHIGLAYLSPYRPTFHRLICAAHPVGEPVATAHRRYVKAFMALTY